VIVDLQSTVGNKRWQKELSRFKTALESDFLYTLSRLRYSAAPLLKDILQNVSLSDISDRDESSYYSFENMKLNGREVSLDDLKLKIHIGTKDLMEFKLCIDKVDIEINNIDFIYNRTSFPTWSDEGKCSAKIETSKWFIRWLVKREYIQRENRHESYFYLTEISCPFKKFDFHVDIANHPNIDNFILGVFYQRIRRRTQRTIEKKLQAYGDRLTEKFNHLVNTLRISPKEGKEKERGEKERGEKERGEKEHYLRGSPAKEHVREGAEETSLSPKFQRLGIISGTAPTAISGTKETQPRESSSCKEQTDKEPHLREGVSGKEQVAAKEHHVREGTSGQETHRREGTSGQETHRREGSSGQETRRKEGTSGKEPHPREGISGKEQVADKESHLREGKEQHRREEHLKEGVETATQRKSSPTTSRLV